MRIHDALSAMRAGKENNTERKKENTDITTIWSEQAKNGQTLTEYPRPQLCRKEWINLNGFWHYAFTSNGSRPEAFDGKILVPFAPESRRSGVGRRLEPNEYLWYFRSLELPELPKGHRMLLHFGAVDERCIVWMNGKILGSHLGGYLPFSYDVTEHVRKGKNTIWVKVQDATDAGTAARGKQRLRPGGMYYTPQSGIWQTVWMECVPENFIQDIKITPLFDEQRVQIELTAATPADCMVTVSGEWSAYQHKIPAAVFREQNRAITGETVLLHEVHACFTIDLPEMHAWSPDDPFLYHIRIKLQKDEIMSYFAMRKFSVGKDERNIPRLMLNNEVLFFNGVLDQGYWPETLFTAPSDEAMEYDIKEMKTLGFNTIRKHVKIEPMRWYYHCDRLGMIVWQDMVSGGGNQSAMLFSYLPNAFPSITEKIRDHQYLLFGRNDEGSRKEWEKECLEMVRHLYNSPCIGMWVLFNEGWGQFDALRIAEEVRQIDPTRLVDPASGWFDQGGGDIISVHNYFRKLRVKKSDRPFVITEYGGASLRVSGHTYLNRSYGYRKINTIAEFAAFFRKLQKRLQVLEKRGLAGAVYTQLSDIEEETNGLLTYDRKIRKI